MVNKKILLISALFLSFYAWAEPGGIYTLTGEEKSIAEIVKADMAKYPELYQGESLARYIKKFENRNNIGKRKLSPGDQLHFPETFASKKKKQAELEEEQAKKKEIEEQRERLLEERVDSFTENDETGWIPEAEFRELKEKLDSKGVWWDQYWVTKIDGRYENDRSEYKLSYEPAPSDGRKYSFYWIYGNSSEAFEKKKKQQKSNGLDMVYEQSFTLPDGEERYQAVWRTPQQ